MDGTRFDAFARARSTTTSRRETIRAMVAAGLGLGLAVLGRPDAGAKKHKKKRCRKVRQGCTVGGKRKCCKALTCEVRPGAASAACCKAAGSTCQSADDCCDGTCLPPLTGDGPKTCRPATICAPTGETCTASADCCEGTCLPPLVGGGAKTCGLVACKPVNKTCESADECCTGVCDPLAMPGSKICI